MAPGRSVIPEESHLLAFPFNASCSAGAGPLKSTVCDVKFTSFALWGLIVLRKFSNRRKLVYKKYINKINA